MQKKRKIICVEYKILIFGYSLPQLENFTIIMTVNLKSYINVWNIIIMKTKNIIIC